MVGDGGLAVGLVEGRYGPQADRETVLVEERPLEEDTVDGVRPAVAVDIVGLVPQVAPCVGGEA